MTPDSVLQYLRDHPEFLEANAAALAQINIPHPETGRAISINERQLLSLRERCRALEGQLSDWVRNGRGNDERGERLHHLTLRVLAAPPAARTEALLEGLRRDFDIPWVWLSSGEVDLATLTGHPGATSEPGCGPVSAGQRSRLSELAGQAIASLAWVPVESGQRRLLLLLGSPDPGRFPADAGIQYLRRIAEILGVVHHGDA